MKELRELVGVRRGDEAELITALTIAYPYLLGER